MVYISGGNVQAKRQGLVPLILGYVYAVWNLIMMFFSTLFSPEAHQSAIKSGRGGGGGGGGGGPRGPRITGIDKIQGGSGSAQCQSGG